MRRGVTSGSLTLRPQGRAEDGGGVGFPGGEPSSAVTLSFHVVRKLQTFWRTAALAGMTLVAGGLLLAVGNAVQAAVVRLAWPLDESTTRQVTTFDPLRAAVFFVPLALLSAATTMALVLLARRLSVPRAIARRWQSEITGALLLAVSLAALVLCGLLLLKQVRGQFVPFVSPVAAWLAALCSSALLLAIAISGIAVVSQRSFRPSRGGLAVVIPLLLVLSLLPMLANRGGPPRLRLLGRQRFSHHEPCGCPGRGGCLPVGQLST